jgi:S1-C subfamily serine protease
MTTLEHMGRHSDRAVGTRGASESPGYRRHTIAATTRVNGFLGVLVDKLDLGIPQGVSVVGTVARSPAARIGLAAGDTITSIAGTGPSSAIALGKIISANRPGQHLDLTWTTPNGTAHYAKVRLSRAR